MLGGRLARGGTAPSTTRTDTRWRGQVRGGMDKTDDTTSNGTATTAKGTEKWDSHYTDTLRVDRENGL